MRRRRQNRNQNQGKTNYGLLLYGIFAMCVVFDESRSPETRSMFLGGACAAFMQILSGSNARGVGAVLGAALPTFFSRVKHSQWSGIGAIFTLVGQAAARLIYENTCNRPRPRPARRGEPLMLRRLR